MILKPSHGKRILKGGEKSGFSPKAAYIFRKQLEEADFIIINRIDELPREQVDELTALIRAEHPDTPVLCLSARTGDNFASLTEMLDQQGAFGRRILDIDYDIYADGEAELGWLNSTLAVTAVEPFALDALLVDIVGRLREMLAQADAETAHLKVIGLWEGFFGVANLTSRDALAELSLPSHIRTREAEIVVNARVAVAPEILEAMVGKAVDEAAAAIAGRAQLKEARSCAPAARVPRIASPSRMAQTDATCSGHNDNENSTLLPSSAWEHTFWKLRFRIAKTAEAELRTRRFPSRAWEPEPSTISGRKTAMIHVIAIIKTASGRRADFLAEFKRIVPLVRAEKGCIEYAPAVDAATGFDVQKHLGPDAMMVIEKWESTAALKDHLSAPTWSNTARA